MNERGKCQDCSEINENEIITRRRKEKPIEMKGWINKTKDQSVMRIFVVNPHGFGPENEEKINKLQTKIKELKIDCYLMSLCNRR